MRSQLGASKIKQPHFCEHLNHTNTNCQRKFAGYEVRNYHRIKCPDDTPESPFKKATSDLFLPKETAAFYWWDDWI
jgi:hypothetical protein